MDVTFKLAADLKLHISTEALATEPGHVLVELIDGVEYGPGDSGTARAAERHYKLLNKSLARALGSALVSASHEV